MAIIVITADLLNPENASSGVKIPVTPKATTTRSATISVGNTSRTNKMIAAARIASVKLV